MAIMHCQIKNISRSNGRSAVASSAYRSGELLKDKETGLTHDYTKKSGIEYTEVILCKNAPQKYKYRATLWNEVQKIEKSKDARLAREWEVAIPKEISLKDGQKLVHDFGQSLANEGMCVDIAIHDKGDGNRHAHIMGTTRAIKENGEWAPKAKKVYDLDQNGERIFQKLDKQNRKIYKNHKEDYTDWNKSEKVEKWRERWANECNKYLSQERKIDHRSYERQGIDQIPTVHEGTVAREIEKNGGVSERCQTNRDIRQYNELSRYINRIEQVKRTVMKQLEYIREKAKEALNERLQRLRTARATDEPVGSDASGNRPIQADYQESRVSEVLRTARADLDSAAAVEKDSRTERDHKIAERKNREASRERQRDAAEREPDGAELSPETRGIEYQETSQEFHRAR